MSSQALFPIVNGKYKMDKEPIVRIGVILSEDGKKSVEFSLPADGYRIDGDAAAEAKKGVYTATLNGGRITVSAGGQTVASGAKMRVVPPAGTEPRKPGDGVLVKKMIAGRGFHWAKEIDQTLSHTLEFLPGENGNLILVNELPLETYLIGVITGEMSGECPIEFMKAQAIAARSWLLGQPRPPHPGQPFLWCNDDCCQRYQGTGGWSERAVQAIDECRAEVLMTRNNLYCDARYSKSTGGVSEDAEVLWHEPIEGLVAITDAPKNSYIQKFFPVTEENLNEYLEGDWLKDTDAFASPNVVPEDTIQRYLGRVDEVGEYFRWKVVVTQDQLRKSLRERAGIADLEKVLDLKCGDRGRSGRLKYMDVVYTATDGSKKTFRLGSEYKIRQGLSSKFLFSGAIRVDIDRAADGSIAKATLVGAGWGHGAGLCQIGGLGRALKGQNYDEILLHYYEGMRLERIY